MGKAILVNTAKCMACRGCQVACKQWNDNPAEATTFFGGPGYQNPADLSFFTFRLVKFFTKGGCTDPNSGKDITSDDTWNFLSFSCMHCVDPNCVSACASTGQNAAKIDGATGFVYIDWDLCIGCQSCQNAGMTPPGCPFCVPRYGAYSGTVHPAGGKASHCHGCWERLGGAGTGQYPLSAAGNSSQYQAGDNDIQTKSLLGTGYDLAPPPTGDLAPACVTACPTGALQFGDRATVVATAAAIEAAGSPEYPNLNAYGDSSFATPSPIDTRVILLLTQPPSFYGLPT